MANSWGMIDKLPDGENYEINCCSYDGEYSVAERNAGITGHAITLAAADMTWEIFKEQHYHFRAAMAEQPDKFLIVHNTRDIEAAHIQGKTAVIWNSQTATILNGDLTRMAQLKDMGIKSMILAYNDIFRTGSGQLAAYNGRDIGLTPWGKKVIDEMVKFGILLVLHTKMSTAILHWLRPSGSRQ